jgi:hypothetical protein
MKKENANKLNKSLMQFSLQEVITRHIIFTEKIKTSGALVANHPTFGVAGGRFCTGPPGRARSPGEGNSLYPDHPPNRLVCLAKSEIDKHPVPQEHLNQVRPLPENYYNTEYQLVSYIKPKFQFITNIKFLKIMKKQILILAFFVLALMAGSLSSYGQILAPSPGGLVPQTVVGCTTDALHPRAGVPYNYGVLINNAAALATAPTGYTWWATQNPNFLDATHLTGDQTGALGVAAGQLIATTPQYNNPAGPINMSITWTPEILALTKYHAVVGDAPKKSTFVAVLANGSCSNNLQVFEIDPKPAFTVDIANINHTSGATLTNWAAQTEAQCVDVVRSAAYNAGNVTMNYGTNTLYFEVTASNFVTSWLPTFQIMAGLSGTQTADLGWATSYANAVAGTFVEPQKTGLAASAVVTAVTPLTSSVANTTNGVSLFVRVVVHNNNWESILDNPFTLAVDGKDASNQWDLKNSDCSIPVAADQDDKATQNVTARPEMIDNSGPGVVAPSFVPKN